MAKKKVEAIGLDVNQKRELVDKSDNVISIRNQCDLLNLNRSTFYQPAMKGESLENRNIMDMIDEIYTENPAYGSRKIRVVLKEMGVEINRKRVQRLMNVMGIESIAPKPNTSKRAPQHKVYPYLLRGLDIDHPNHVWATDITYIRTAKGFCYLVAVVDWYSRAVLSWRVSNTMDTDFCAEALQEAIDKYGCPEIFNTDQGSQFTSEKFTGILKTNGIEISMDGKGRALDNIIVERLWRTVKYEDIYPKGYETIREVKEGLTAFFLKYNNRRPHQTHDYKCPMEVYLKYESKMALAA